MRSGRPWALASHLPLEMLTQESKTQFAEELPRPLGRREERRFVRGVGQEAGQGCWTR